jgi:hypothetical protein
MLANKVSGNLAGIWLLVAEHIRLGTWDLLCHWTQQPTAHVAPRLALQMVHEAAVCTTGIRSERTLHQRGGFELANGLPFVATDQAIHHLLNGHTVRQSMNLQTALGKLRKASKHYKGKVLAIDPHRVISYSKREFSKKVERREDRRPFKMAQTFWVLDADTHQPVCFVTATSSRNITEVTADLLNLAQSILNPASGSTLVVADCEHFSGALIADVKKRTGLDLLVPVPSREVYRKRYREIPERKFTRQWAGYATAKVPMKIEHRHPGEYILFVERFGERREDLSFKGFLCTRNRKELDALTTDYPKRWHLEEFFNANQALGWKRAGTLNLNVRYGQMTMALIAQASIHQLRTRLGEPYSNWDAAHLSRDLFHGLEGDVRVTHDTIIVTYYNAPPDLCEHYMDLPAKLKKEGVEPTIPWLYDYKLDFRFR